jgi:aspartyl-tRNA(Asn)/glutamyl-tRNA(Gln) amidotransferase subunit A
VSQSLNAVVTVLDPGAPGSGPLAGLRFGIKDNIGIAGVASTCASAFFADRIAAADAEVVSRLRDAGASLVATLNMAEFAMGVTSQNSVHGGVRNPWDLDRIPGGSSGGSGAAVAAGPVDVALGTDTGGSVRIPASMNGVTGLRPTVGSVSDDGVFPVCLEADVVGPLARSVGLVARTHAVLTGRPVAGVAPPSTVGVVTVPLAVDDGVAVRVDAAVRDLESAGARLVPVTVPGFAEVRESLYTVVYADVAAQHRERILGEPERFQPDTLTRFRLGLDTTPAQRAAAMAEIEEFRRGLDALFADVDVLLTPTVAVDVPLIGGDPDVLAVTRRVGELTAPWSAHLGPTLALPVGPHPGSGMPVGVQLTGPAGSEDLLFAAGATFQRRTSWHELRPPLHAA